MLFASSPNGDRDCTSKQVTSKNITNSCRLPSNPHEFMDLSTEAHFGVMDFITEIKDLGHIAQVSSYWNAIVQNFHKHSVIVIGNTGSGVSSLVHLLAGKNLIATGPDYRLRVEAADKSLGIEIGHGAYSYTLNPESVYNSENKTIIWNCPGFCHTKGVEQDYKNALSIHKLLTGNLKVILLVDGNEFNIRYGIGILETVSKISEIFLSQDQLKKSLYLVISKTQEGNNVSTKLENIKSLKETFPYNRCISYNGVGLIQHLIDNPIRIAEFKVPTKKGVYIPCENLKNLINDKCYISNPSINTPRSGINSVTGWLG